MAWHVIRVRSKDAKKQLARTSLKWEICLTYFLKELATHKLYNLIWQTTKHFVKKYKKDMLSSYDPCSKKKKKNAPRT